MVLKLVVEKADSMEIRIIAGTDYFEEDPTVVCDNYEQKLSKREFSEILSAHIKDYQELFNRVTFSLPASAAKYFTTDERIRAQKRKADDPSLAALYFQYGRYLLISSSRENNMPANLQGLWGRWNKTTMEF